jgi:hypothetical protein
MNGVLPTELGLLTALEGVDFGRSEFSGTLPTEIGRLSNLSVLSVYRNEMTGTIPSQLGELTALGMLSCPMFCRLWRTSTWLFLLFCWLTVLLHMSGFLCTSVAQQRLSGSVHNNNMNPEHLLLAWNSFDGSIPTILCEGSSEILRDCTVECECCFEACLWELGGS